MPVVPALWRLRQEDHHEFKANLNYIARTVSKKIVALYPIKRGNKFCKANPSLYV